MYGVRHMKWMKPYWQYRCTNRSNYANCDSPTVSVTRTDERVKAQLRQLPIGSTIRSKMREDAAATARDCNSGWVRKLQALSNEAGMWDKRLKKLYNRALDGIVSSEQVAEMAADMQNALQLAKESLARHQQQAEPDVDLESILTFLSEASWDDLDFEGWQRSINLLVERVQVDGPNVQVSLVPAAQQLLDGARLSPGAPITPKSSDSTKLG